MNANFDRNHITDEPDTWAYRPDVDSKPNASDLGPMDEARLAVVAATFDRERERRARAA